MSPSDVPTTSASAVAATPMSTSTWGAAMTREKMSRPVWSVPNQWTGCSSEPFRVCRMSDGMSANAGGGTRTSGVGSTGS